MDEIRMYLSTLVCVILSASVLLVATVVLHEAGHYAAGNMLGCSGVKIVLLDGSFSTYTSMNCQSLGQETFGMLLLSGMTFIVPLSLLLYRRHRFHALIMFGFNLVISSSDFSYFPQFVGYSSLLIGAALVLYSEALLIDRHIRYKTVVPSYLPSR